MTTLEDVTTELITPDPEPKLGTPEGAGMRGFSGMWNVVATFVPVLHMVVV
jgi:hypothetical protein